MTLARVPVGFVCFLGLAAASVRGARAEEDGSTPAAEAVSAATVGLSLAESMVLALERNLEIEVQRYFPLIAAEDVTFERGAFDPALSSVLSYTESEQQGGVQFRSIFGAESFRTKDLEWDTSLRKRTTVGTEVGAGYALTREDLIVSGQREEDGTVEPFSFHTEEYRSRLYVDLNQPLLQGFGTGVNTAMIRIAGNREQAAFLLFLDRIEEVLAGTQKAYWELVFAARSVEIAEQALELARSFERLAESRLRAGTGLRNDVLQAKAQVADREADVLQVVNLLRDNEDILRTLLRLTDTREEWTVGLEPTDEPTTVPTIPPLGECITEAFANRYDYRVAKLDVEQREIQVVMARNERYPVLDLFGAIAALGLEDTPGRSLETATDGDFYEVTAGLRFNYPLGNQSAEGRHRRALWEEKQAGASMELLEDRIIREVRQAWRHIESDAKRIEARERGRVFAEEKLTIEEQRYRVGRATSVDVLDFQEDLTRARVQETRARVDYLESWINLERSKGTLAKGSGVEVEGLIQRESRERDAAPTEPTAKK